MPELWVPGAAPLDQFVEGCIADRGFAQGESRRSRSRSASTARCTGRAISRIRLRLLPSPAPTTRRRGAMIVPIGRPPDPLGAGAGRARFGPSRLVGLSPRSWARTAPPGKSRAVHVDVERRRVPPGSRRSPSGRRTRQPLELPLAPGARTGRRSAVGPAAARWMCAPTGRQDVLHREPEADPARRLDPNDRRCPRRRRRRGRTCPRRCTPARR